MRIKTNLLKAAALFAAKKDVRFYLNGVVIKSTPSEYSLIATDGHALIVITSEREPGDGSPPVEMAITNDDVGKIIALKRPEFHATRDNLEHGLIFESAGMSVTAIDMLSSGAKFPDLHQLFKTVTTSDVPHYKHLSVRHDLIDRVGKATKLISVEKYQSAKIQPSGDHFLFAIESGRVHAFGLVMKIRDDAPMTMAGHLERANNAWGAK